VESSLPFYKDHFLHAQLVIVLIEKDPKTLQINEKKKNEKMKKKEKI
jgi:hypothetical protein